MGKSAKKDNLNGFYEHNFISTNPLIATLFTDHAIQ